MTKEEREHELMRRELWIKVASSVVTCENTKTATTATSWANKVLEGFDEKFKAMEPIEIPDEQQ